jgi:uncharacterized protein (TIRG00374 family)
MKDRLKSRLVLAVRFAFTGALLGIAFLLIDFSDRTVVTLATGKKLEAVAVHRSGTEVHARLPNGEIRILKESEVKGTHEQPGLLSVLKRARLWPAMLVIPLLAILYISQAARWRLLLRANGFDVPMGRAVRITWAGAFFNQILPGSVGGDVAKALIVAKGEGRKAAVFGTVLLDRLVGLATVVLIAGFAILPVLDRKEMIPVVGLIVAILAGGALGAAIYFNPGIRRWGPARRLKDRLPLRRSIEEVDDVLKTMHHAPRTILAAVGLSAAGQVATILAIYALALSLGADRVPLSDYFVFEPIIFLVTALPISVGGWGVEQVAYAQLFGMAGMAANTAIALSVLYKLSVLVIALPGGILFAAGATRRRS